MNYYDSNSAYDLTYFEEEIEDEEENEIQIKYKEQIQKQRKNVKVKQEKKLQRARMYNKLKSIIYVTVVISILGACCVRLTYLSAINNELNNKIAIQQQLLQEVESENTQLDMKIETILSPTVIEKYAAEVLSMTKLDDSKKEYIRLDEGDKVVLAENNSDNTFSTIINQIIDLF